MFGRGRLVPAARAICRAAGRGTRRYALQAARTGAWTQRRHLIFKPPELQSRTALRHLGAGFGFDQSRQQPRWQGTKPGWHSRGGGQHLWMPQLTVPGRHGRASAGCAP
jgi:hypothetical protein